MVRNRNSNNTRTVGGTIIVRQTGRTKKTHHHLIYCHPGTPILLLLRRENSLTKVCIFTIILFLLYIIYLLLLIYIIVSNTSVHFPGLIKGDNETDKQHRFRLKRRNLVSSFWGMLFSYYNKKYNPPFLYGIDFDKSEFPI